ncbi:MAG TPA: DUF6580 family putative transport protein [Phnomibacter sp.]|nr:DUF6580 family putative transport protein [Phnomibacter sp.]
MNRKIAFLFAVLIVVCALYRMVPYEMRPEWLGAPQIAMAIFAGSVIKDRKWAFAVPLFSMLFSDILMQGMHWANPTAMAPGFYKGQLLNYILILSTTVIGFFINSKKASQVLAGAVAAPVIYFLLSNTAVWIGGGGYFRPKTFDGLLLTLTDGIPFLKTSLAGTLLFSGVFFGSAALLTSERRSLAKA